MTQREEGIATLVALRLEGNQDDLICWCAECKRWWQSNALNIVGEDHKKSTLYSCPCDGCYETERETARGSLDKYWLNARPYKEAQDEPTEASTAAC